MGRKRERQFWFSGCESSRVEVSPTLTSLESSEDHVLVVMIRSLGTQCSYTAHSALMAI